MECQNPVTLSHHHPVIILDPVLIMMKMKVLLMYKGLKTKQKRPSADGNLGLPLAFALKVSSSILPGAWVREQLEARDWLVLRMLARKRLRGWLGYPSQCLYLLEATWRSMTGGSGI
ncbi:hypothetical protein Tco_1278090 [Tanacetum coccineum]